MARVRSQPPKHFLSVLALALVVVCLNAMWLVSIAALRTNGAPRGYSFFAVAVSLLSMSIYAYLLRRAKGRFLRALCLLILTWHLITLIDWCVRFY